MDKNVLMARIDASKTQSKAQIDVLKAQMSVLDVNFDCEMKKAEHKRNNRLKQFMDDEPNEAKRRKLVDNTRK